MKKLVLLLIAACMVITCFACGGNGGKKPKPGVPSADEKWNALPEYDFDGTKFRVSTRGTYGSMEVVVDDETSENVVDQALVLRNAMVEDRYGVFIELDADDGSANVHTNNVLTACMMQLDTFDLAMTYVYESAPLITNGFVLNWAQLPYTKLDQSHWINGMNNEFSVRHAIYTAVSKMCVTILGQTVAVLYNRDLGDAWKGEEFSQELVDTVLAGNGKEGGWTYDYLMNIINEYVWEDKTGDGKTSDDTFAFYMTRDWSIDSWHSAWEIPCIKNSVEDGLEDVMWNEKYVEYANRMHTMYYETPSIFYGDRTAANEAFVTNRALFITSGLSWTTNYFPDAMVDSVYTILPQPKYDDNQKNYRSAMFDNYSVMSIPVTADPEFVSLIVEALSIASEQNVYPAYRQDALQGTGVADLDSIEMLDIILDSSSWDIATLLSSQVSMINAVRKDVIAYPGSSQISQTYESMQPNIETALTNIMKAFDEFQNN